MSFPRRQGFGTKRAPLRVRQTDHEVSRQTEPLVDSVNQLAQSPLLNSSQIEGIEFSTLSGSVFSETREVRHLLGRPYRGWFVCCQPNPSVRISEVTQNDRKKDVLLLRLQNDAANPGPDTLTHKISVVVF